MTNEIDKTNQIIDLIKGAKSIAIIPSKIAGVDSFAAAVGLFHMLREENKNVTIVYPGSKPEEFSDIKDVDITSNVAERELLVTVDYSGTDASKVHYSTDNNMLYLTITPISKDFDLTRVKPLIRGFNFDTIITIGAQMPEDFGQTYNELHEDFVNSDILNLDNTDRNQRFGTINIIDSNVNSLSLLVLEKSLKWALRLNEKAAEALLRGIKSRKGI
jgi:nanoRNase/pAp phosphatase (c-di-AMP/oligoRNAs hydrolase)